MNSLPTDLLDIRKKIILKTIVNDYVRTAEPVGSHALMERCRLGVKSATIRNEMAELSDLGYLQQPHTSAGRIPSDLGYRFYVDRLMDDTILPSSEASVAKQKLKPRRSEVDIILEQTCRILSDLSRYTSMATDPEISDTVISHVSVAVVAPQKLVAMVVLDNGRIIHELLELDAKTKLDPVKATNFLTQMLVGKTLTSFSKSSMEPIPQEAVSMKELLGKVHFFLRRELESEDEGDVHLGGTSYIVQQPEFKESNRLEAVFSVLEHRSALYKLFSSVYIGSEITVIIGRENPLDEMRDCSFVGTKYRIGNRTAGTIGVVGPTRMDYRRAVSAVEFMARNLSELLTELSLS